jgi:nucleotidyltransferase/DNA polymerase involved in DNA repair
MSARNNRILHIDGDSFFASCEIALDPKLEGRPVWVGGGRRGDGIVIAAIGPDFFFKGGPRF